MAWIGDHAARSIRTATRLRRLTFEQLSRRARFVVVRAQIEARYLRHRHVGTEHLLLALAGQGGGHAVELLGELGVQEADVRADLERMCPRGSYPPPARMPFTDGAVKSLRQAVREATQLGDPVVSTEHILLGIATYGNGIGRQIMNEWFGRSGKPGDVLRTLITRSASRPHADRPDHPGQ